MYKEKAHIAAQLLKTINLIDVKHYRDRKTSDRYVSDFIILHKLYQCIQGKQAIITLITIHQLPLQNSLLIVHCSLMTMHRTIHNVHVEL